MAPQKEITYNSTSYSVKTSPSKIVDIYLYSIIFLSQHMEKEF